MRPSESGIKQEIHEGAQGARKAPFRFIHHLTLSQHPPEHRKGLFMQKFRSIVIAKSLHPTDFQGYTIRERFVKMGWGQLLNFNCDKIYRRVVIQWMSTLSKDGDELTGIVDGKSYTITPVIIRNLLGVDTRTDLPYARFNKAEFQANTDENRRWIDARKTVFRLNEDSDVGLGEYQRSKMTPLVKILWQIGVWTFYPRLGDVDCNYLRIHEIYLLHALFTGDHLYSFAHLMIDDIWDMYEHEYRKIIPHGYYISEILSRLGAVPENESVEMVPLQYRSLSKKSFPDLEFSESPTTYIVADRVTGQRVVLQKEGESPLQPPHHQMPTPSPHTDVTHLLTNLENLTIKQFSQSQEKHNEMISMVSNMVKQMERQTLEAERREQERLRQAEERERERERRAEEREQERERRAEERERNAEIRAHAIIWDIERQRYLYEQEQQQLRMTWNQVNAVNTGDDFQFPQISHNSFHPPRAGSRYHDPTRSDEIPKAFQSLYHDIYGPRH